MSLSNGDSKMFKSFQKTDNNSKDVTKSVDRFDKGKSKVSESKKVIEALKSGSKNTLKNHLLYGIFNDKGKKRAFSPVK